MPLASTTYCFPTSLPPRPVKPRASPPNDEHEHGRNHPDYNRRWKDSGLGAVPRRRSKGRYQSQSESNRTWSDNFDLSAANTVRRSALGLFRRPRSLVELENNPQISSSALTREGSELYLDPRSGSREPTFTSFLGSSHPSRLPWQKSLSEGNLNVSGRVELEFRPQESPMSQYQWNWKPSEEEVEKTRTKNFEDVDGNMTLTRQKSVPKFFRSISLKNLLQIGGMNKSRPSPAQGKRVSPPTVPLTSFPSFRAKKNPQGSVNKEELRYSGGSLGSAGSSYTTSSNSSSSSGDNRSSIGADDIYFPSSNGHILKDFEEGAIYNPASQEVYLKSSNSFNSFTPVNNRNRTFAVDMHQGLYGKLGTSSQHVTVEVENGTGNGSNSGTKVSASAGSPAGIQHKHPHQAQMNNVFPSASHSAQPVTNHYQTQISIEDQGIDMTQSPGRESPSSTASSNTGSGSNGSAVGSVGSGSNGCRHSTSSFDSGRASATIYQQGVRYSGLSSESSSGSFRHSYHSSSSSLGSIAPEEICNFDVSAMITQGIPDHEILNAWLTGIHFEVYYQKFILAGYDMHTISRMTPEDLNAIGVTKPNHRKRLKAEISQLNIPDGLPDFIPGTIEDWLGLLKLEEYNMKLRGQGYQSVRQVTNITWEDLEDIGILKLGHQKKFMLAIKRIEDILAGKRIPTGPNAYLTPMDSFPSRPMGPSSSNSKMGMNYGNSQGVTGPQIQNGHYHPPNYQNRPLASNQSNQQGSQIWRQQPSQSNIYAHAPVTLTHQPQLHHSPSTPQYHPEVISIHVKNHGRRKSMDNTAQEPIYGTSSFLPQTNSPYQSSKFDEGDTTPTNEPCPLMNSLPSTSTLPRLLKNKPIAKIMGGGNGDMQQSTGTAAYCQQAMMGNDGYKSLPRDIGRISKAAGGGLINGNHLVSFNGTSFGKNGPPPPPRRTATAGSHEEMENWSGILPPPPPQLTSTDLVRQNNEEFPPPPPPDDLHSSSHHSFNQTPSTSASTSSSTSPNNPIKMVTTTSVVHYQNYPNNGQYHQRTSPPSVVNKTSSRDPSPVGSDFSESDLANNGYFTRGVRRNGSDASFKSNSSTESESIPFANDNAGTIKQQKSNSRIQPAPIESHNGINTGTGDVLNDIGNMLADLTDELDAILEQEMSSKR